jgi:hypothetical protein
MSEQPDAQPNSIVELWWNDPNGDQVKIHAALPDKPWWETVKVGDMMPLHVLRVIETKDRE